MKILQNLLSLSNTTLSKVSEVPLYLGIAVAVAGVAVTFFTGAPFVIPMSFAFLGVASAIGVYKAIQARQLTQFQQNVEALDTVKKGLETQVGTFSQENETLKESIKTTKEENEKFRTSNADLTANVTTFSEANATLEAQNKELEQNIALLVAHNAALERSTQSVTKVVEDLNRQAEVNEKSGEKVSEATSKLLAVLGSGAEAIKQSSISGEVLMNKVCSKFDHNIKKSMENATNFIKMQSAEEVQARQALLKEQKALLAEQQQQYKLLNLMADNLTKSVESLTKTEGSLRNSVEGLEKTDTSLKNSVNKASELLESLSTLSSSINTDFAGNNTELKATIAKLQQLAGSFLTPNIHPAHLNIPTSSQKLNPPIVA